MNENLSSELIRVSEYEDYAVILPLGYFNATVGDQIDKVCESLIQRNIRHFVVNFSQVEMINTIGISILVGLIEKVSSRQGLVYFTEVGGTNLEIFEVLHLNAVVMMLSSDHAALEHIHNDLRISRRAEGQ
jgi:anti-anti-sigma factor